MYEAWPAAKQPRQKRISRARKGGCCVALVFFAAMKAGPGGAAEGVRKGGCCASSDMGVRKGGCCVALVFFAAMVL